jgi:hypothetical protein
MPAKRKQVMHIRTSMTTIPLTVLAALSVAACDSVPVVQMERVPDGPIPSAAPLEVPPALSRSHWEVVTVTPELGLLHVDPSWIVSTPLLAGDAEPANRAPSVRARLEAALANPGATAPLGWSAENWLDVITLR